MTQLGLGACLADDMGLGKTMQVIALLLHLRSAGAEECRSSLLVVPASLLGNWKSELARFAPSLKVTILHPSELPDEQLDAFEAEPARQLGDTDLLITTYGMLHRTPWLAGVKWRLAILDEAQAIKNASTRQSQATRKLQASARVALTGTPVENRLGDLWSLFDFLNPGLLGNAKAFSSYTKKLASRADAGLPAAPFADPAVHPAAAQDRQDDHRRSAGQDGDEGVLLAGEAAGGAVSAGGGGAWEADPDGRRDSAEGADSGDVAAGSSRSATIRRSGWAMASMRRPRAASSIACARCARNWRRGSRRC